MNNKLFTIAGTSTLNGVNTFRFATGKLNVRVSKLTRHGHTDVALQELPDAMTKIDAVAFLTAQGVNAVVPATRGKAKTVAEVLTPEQIAAAAEADKKAQFVKRMAEARAAKAAVKQAAEDAAFFATQAGDTAGAAALLAEVAEHGADVEREIAAAEAVDEVSTADTEFFANFEG